MKKITLALLFTASTLFLSSCIITSAISTAVVVSNDRRSAGEIIDDNSIKFSLLNWGGEDKKLENANLNFNIYNKKVLITGEVPDADTLNYINKQAPLQDFKIKDIVNEARIGKNSSLFSRAKDATITAKIKISFYDQEVFNPLHVEVTTENNAAYLMGALTQREANKAAEIASKIIGVKRVVKVIDYLKQRPATEIAREKEKQLMAQKQKELAEKRAVIEAKKAELRRQIKELDPDGGTSF
ncbi:MAG: BON domain-containing protein [Candidatus Thioglobus sp.]|nr:MAG: BON domain-containing protein [Candidatus Thioglobus sp.]KAA0456936.1 MAG: BON domain-containing protein [Candidatus Thioglobus sp.]